MAVSKLDKEIYLRLQQEARVHACGNYRQKVVEALAEKGITVDIQQVSNVMKENALLKNWDILDAVREFFGLPYREEKKLVTAGKVDLKRLKLRETA